MVGFLQPKANRQIEIDNRDALFTNDQATALTKYLPSLAQCSMVYRNLTFEKKCPVMIGYMSL